MKNTISPTSQRLRREHMLIVCEWLASFALLLLPVFFLLFCSVLFCVWYFGAYSWWLMAISVVLSAGMTMAAGIFAVASASFPSEAGAIGAHDELLAGAALNSVGPYAAKPVPVSFPGMSTRHCSQQYRDRTAFGVHCFNTNCKGPRTGERTSCGADDCSN